MDKLFDIVAIGEILIDFTPKSAFEAGNPIFECNPGGAPPNALVAAARQGSKTAFVGKVGNDDFGAFLKDTLVENNINVDYMIIDEKIPTTLAFVTLSKEGDRSFSFYRKPGADIMLSTEDIDKKLIASSSLLHFGSLSLTDEPSRSATLFALKLARENDLYISYDPNLRPSLWDSLDIAKEQILSVMPYADILKISEEELEFLTGEKSVVTGSEKLLAQYANLAYLFVTMGPKGAFFCHNQTVAHMQTFDVPVVDTTGSGDSFMGTIISYLSKLTKDEFFDLNEHKLRWLVDTANASGSLTATKYGGIPSMPTGEEIEHCKKNYSYLMPTEQPKIPHHNRKKQDNMV